MGLFVFDEKDNRLDVSDSLDIIKCVALSGEQITTGMFVKYANGTRNSLGLVVMVARSIDEAIGVVVDAPAFTIGSNERVFAVQRKGKCIVAAETGESFSSVTQYVSVSKNGKAKSESLSFKGYRVLDTVDSNHAVIWFEDKTSGLGLFNNRFKFSFINAHGPGITMSSNSQLTTTMHVNIPKNILDIVFPYYGYTFNITGSNTQVSKQNGNVPIVVFSASHSGNGVDSFGVDITYNIKNMTTGSLSNYNIYFYIYILVDTYVKLL